jgi:hypothetical protein
MNLSSLETLPLPINIQVLSSIPGRIRLRVSPKHRQPEVMAQIVSTLKAFFSEIRDVRMNVQTGSITVYYDGNHRRSTSQQKQIQPHRISKCQPQRFHFLKPLPST